MRPKLTKHEITTFREHLCDEALQIYVEQGYAALSMRSLAKSIGCSPMAIYRYFEDKNEIVATIKANAFRQLSNTIEEALKSETSSVRARSRAVGEAYMNFAFQNPSTYRLMFEISPADRMKYPELKKQAQRAKSLLRKNTEDLVDAGILIGDPELLSNIIQSACHGVVSLKLAGQFVGKTAHLDAFAGIFDAIMGHHGKKRRVRSRTS